jgi:hypothetical protein
LDKYNTLGFNSACIYFSAAAGAATAQAVSAATAAAVSTPETAAVATGVAIGLPAVLLWQAAFSGYAGTLDPEQALNVLQVPACLALLHSWALCV